MSKQSRAARKRAETEKRRSEKDKRMRNPTGGSDYAHKVAARSGMNAIPVIDRPWEPRPFLPLRSEPYQPNVVTGVHVNTASHTSGNLFRFVVVDGDMKFI